MLIAPLFALALLASISNSTPSPPGNTLNQDPLKPSSSPSSSSKAPEAEAERLILDQIKMESAVKEFKRKWRFFEWQHRFKDRYDRSLILPTVLNTADYDISDLPSENGQTSIAGSQGGQQRKRDTRYYRRGSKKRNRNSGRGDQWNQIRDRKLEIGERLKSMGRPIRIDYGTRDKGGVRLSCPPYKNVFFSDGALAWYSTSSKPSTDSLHSVNGRRPFKVFRYFDDPLDALRYANSH